MLLEVLELKDVLVGELVLELELVDVLELPEIEGLEGVLVGVLVVDDVDVLDDVLLYVLVVELVDEKDEVDVLVLEDYVGEEDGMVKLDDDDVFVLLGLLEEELVDEEDDVDILVVVKLLVLPYVLEEELVDDVVLVGELWMKKWRKCAGAAGCNCARGGGRGFGLSCGLGGVAGHGAGPAGCGCARWFWY
eukprot:6491951-Amphidinium_carterae.2